MHYSGLADSCHCDCSLGEEDDFHFLFKCPAHFANRTHLFTEIQEILSDGVKPYATQINSMRKTDAGAMRLYIRI